MVSLCGYSTGCSGFSGGFWVLVVVGFLWVSGFVCCSGLVGFVLVVCCLRRVGGCGLVGWRVGFSGAEFVVLCNMISGVSVVWWLV